MNSWRNLLAVLSLATCLAGGNAAHASEIECSMIDSESGVEFTTYTDGTQTEGKNMFSISELPPPNLLERTSLSASTILPAPFSLF